MTPAIYNYDRLTDRLWLGGLMLALLLALLLGCSPTQAAWVERADRGVAFAVDRETARYERDMAQLTKDRKRDVIAAYKDVLLSARNGVPISATQPATQPIDDKWTAESQAVLLAQLDNYDQKRTAMETDYRAALENLGQIKIAHANILRLNAAWAGDRDQLAAEFDRLATILQQTQNAKRRRRPRLTKDKVTRLAEAAWADFKARHPNQAERIEEEEDTPALKLFEGLTADAEFEALSKQTDIETSIAVLVEKFMPVVDRLIVGWLGA